MALFNKDGRGSEELYALTGVFYASNDYSAIAGEICDATRELVNIVGGDVVTRAENAYSEGTDAELVQAVQMPIACLAMSRYFKQTAISHESSGRKFKVDSNEKMPFEWMLDRDDQAMRERYFRALDALFDYLDSADVEEWKKSRVFLNTERSIVKDLRTFESVYPIEQSYYTFFMLLPLIVEVQATKLKRSLGESWGRITADTVADDDKELLYFAQRAAILNAVLVAVERWSLEVFPQSVARRFLPTYQGNRASQVASTSEMDWYIDKLRSQADMAIEEMLAEANGNNHYADYPLLPENNSRKKYFTAGM